MEGREWKGGNGRRGGERDEISAPSCSKVHVYITAILLQNSVPCRHRPCYTCFEPYAQTCCVSFYTSGFAPVHPQCSSNIQYTQVHCTGACMYGEIFPSVKTFSERIMVMSMCVCTNSVAASYIVHTCT